MAMSEGQPAEVCEKHPIHTERLSEWSIENDMW